MAEPMQGVYAMVAVDPDGTEGIVGLHTPDGWVPLVCSDRVDPTVLLDAAGHVANASGRALRLLHFTARAVILEMLP